MQSVFDLAIMDRALTVVQHRFIYDFITYVYLIQFITGLTRMQISGKNEPSVSRPWHLIYCSLVSTPQRSPTCKLNAASDEW